MTEAAEKKREPDWGSGTALGLVFGVVMAIVLDNWAFLGTGVALSVAFAYALGTTPSDDESTAASDIEGAGPDASHGDDPDAPGPAAT